MLFNFYLNFIYLLLNCYLNINKKLFKRQTNVKSAKIGMYVPKYLNYLQIKIVQKIT